MSSFLTVLKSKTWLGWIIAGLLAISLSITYTDNRKLSNQLDYAVKQTEQLSKRILECEAREHIRETEIAKWKAISNEKQEKLNIEVANRLKVEDDLKSQITKKWDNQKFPTSCEKGIDLLRQHAIQLKGKRQ